MNKNFWRRNGSTILTIVGVIGVFGTGVSAARSTVKALDILEMTKKEKGEDLTEWEVVKAVAPSYIPPILIGFGTIMCITGANILNKKTQAALSSAYVVLDQSYKEYKKKVTDLYGESTNDIVRSEIAKDHYKVDEFEDEEDDGKTLYFDELSNRYFRAFPDTVARAKYDLNKEVSEGYGASLNDFYDMLGIEKVSYGDYVGWESGQLLAQNWSDWVDVRFSKVETEDGLECFIMHVTEPMPLNID